MGNMLLRSAIVIFLLMGVVTVFINRPLFAEDKAVKATNSYPGPGLGEIMSGIQQHHAKLFFAGMEANWGMASYQLNEIKEGLESAYKLHPHFKDITIPLTRMIPMMMDKSIDDVSANIRQKNKDAFLRSYDALTASCNSCHLATKYEYIVLQRPSGSEYSNMEFTVR